MTEPSTIKHCTFGGITINNICLVIVQEGPSESERDLLVGECVLDGTLPDQSGSLKKCSESQVLIQSLHNTTMNPDNIKPIRACMPKVTSDITIYYYKSSMLRNLNKGIPVVLNISNSNQFLKCTFDQAKAVLSRECFEKDKLDLIHKNDSLTWPFVFYFFRTKDNCCHFESAECSGWFIRTASTSVCMDKDTDRYSEETSYLIIQSPNNS